MNDTVKKTPSGPASAAKAPKKLIPRTAPKAAAQAPTGENNAPPSAAKAPRAAAKPAAAPTTKPRAPRKPSAVEETVAKHQKVLAEALSKAQAIQYDQPKVMKQDVPKKGKPAKARKIKLVRDSYAMPETEHARIGELKKRLAALGNEVKKSELLRAGIALLAALNDAELKAVMGRVERIKTGRPTK